MSARFLNEGNNNNQMGEAIEADDIDVNNPMAHALRKLKSRRKELIKEILSSNWGVVDHPCEPSTTIKRIRQYQDLHRRLGMTISSVIPLIS